MRLAGILLALSLLTSRPAAQALTLDAVSQRLATYLSGYPTALANIVAEERYHQSLTQPPGDTRSRTLRSDYALTRAAQPDVWIGYRDTFAVDGRPVRDREARLQRLLAAGAFDQAERIAEQNARFNLGNDLLPRTINIPTFALELLQERYRGRFSRRRRGTDVADGREGWVIEFRERGRPTIVRTPAGRDQPTVITVLADPWSGEVLRTVVTWERLHGTVTVTYGIVPDISVRVPLRMVERYTTSDGTLIAAEAEYSNFRRFETAGRLLEP